MKKAIFIIFLFLTILLVHHVHAAYVKTTSFNGKQGWIVATASGQKTFDNPIQVSLPNDFEIRHPSRHDTAWRLVNGSVISDSTGAVIEPEPSEALDRFITHATTLTGSKQTAYVELSKRPALLLTILSGRYEDTKIILDQLVADGTLSSSRAQQFKDILDGTFIP